jgi:hypothetical protein
MAAPSEYPPVVILTNEDIAAFRREEAALTKHPDDTFVSPFSDESVQGYLTDETPRRNGVGAIKEVVDILHRAGIPCCLVAQPALIYYGTGRVMHVSCLYSNR